MSAQITTVRAQAWATIRSHSCRVTLGLLVAAATLLLFLNSATVLAEDVKRQALRDHLQARLSQHAPADAEATAIQNFYLTRDYAPAWLGVRHLSELRRLGEFTQTHGLNPDDYQLTTLAQLIELLLVTDSVEELATAELQATESVARLAGDLRLGKVNLIGSEAAPRGDRDEVRVGELLTAAADSESLLAYLDELTPDTYLYQKLLTSLARHRLLLEQGTVWPIIPRGRTLHVGMTDPRVPELRQRLSLPARETDNDVYDADLANSVSEFQAKYLLEVDGLLGTQTIATLNTSIRERIGQLRVNLEWQRWAAMPNRDEYLLVNVAHQTLHLMRDGERAWSTRTQVGTVERPTPTFKSTVTAIMANPSWTVPPTIFREDLLPQLQADPNFLQRKQMRVVDRSGEPVDQTTIDWQATDAVNSGYRLRAGPGADNPLGRMKFLIPNPYLIYLHDTPTQHLFAHERRAFSSGCIRIQHPAKLAEFLLERQPGVNGRARLNEALSHRLTRYLDLERPIPIVVMYATADLDATGELVLAGDLYGKDTQVLAALESTSERGRNGLLLAAAMPQTRD